MRVIVPHTRLDPRARALLDEHARGWSSHPLNPADRAAYTRLFATEWGRGSDFMVVEHDIGIRAGVVEELAACRRPWCGFPYPIEGEDTFALGCTRFRGRLTAAHPDLPARLAGDWHYLDRSVDEALFARGIEFHEHWPAVTHFHAY